MVFVMGAWETTLGREPGRKDASAAKGALGTNEPDEDPEDAPKALWAWVNDFDEKPEGAPKTLGVAVVVDG